MKTKTFYRGNNLIGLNPVVGRVMDEGLLEAQRYATTRVGGDSAPRIPATPKEAADRAGDTDAALMTRGRC